MQARARFEHQIIDSMMVLAMRFSKGYNCRNVDAQIYMASPMPPQGQGRWLASGAFFGFLLASGALAFGKKGCQNDA